MNLFFPEKIFWTDVLTVQDFLKYFVFLFKKCKKLLPRSTKRQKSAFKLTSNVESKFEEKTTLETLASVCTRLCLKMEVKWADSFAGFLGRWIKIDPYARARSGYIILRAKKSN